MRKTPKIIIFLAVVFVSGYNSFLFYRGNKMNSRFYTTKTNSIVLDSGTWQYNSIEYRLSDGLQFKLAYNLYEQTKINIDIGDSIVKKEDSLDFDIYKKNRSGKYEFHHNIHEALRN